MSKRHQRWLLACVAGLGSLYVDKCLTGSKLAFGQMVICTFFAFGIVGVQAGKSLMRPRQASVALALAALHFVGLVRLASCFPMANSLVGIVVAGVEAIVLMFLYARIGQTVDPRGPFDLTAAEIEKKRMLQEHLKSTL